jgi:hypothetical protein
MLQVCIQKNRMNIFHEGKSGMRRGDKKMIWCHLITQFYSHIGKTIFKTTLFRWF